MCSIIYRYSQQAMVPNKFNRHLLKSSWTSDQAEIVVLHPYIEATYAKEAETMGDFVAPGRNAPLVRASFRIAHMTALYRKPVEKAEDVVASSALQIDSDELLQVFPLQSKKRTHN